MTPQRHHRLRVPKGVRQPPNTRYCGRGTIYGNNWIIDKWYSDINRGCFMTREMAISLYGQNLSLQAIASGFASEEDFLIPLLKFDYLSCFCSLDEACHVDVLIERLLRLESPSA